MTFDEYDAAAASTAIYPGVIIYPTLGLVGEAGKVAEKVKKVIRDRKGNFDLESRIRIAKELGDVLWYLSALARDLGFNLDDAARINLTKLAERKRTGNLQGSGDERGTVSADSLAQPAPVKNSFPAVWPLVVDDMNQRDAVGTERYGVPLQPHNGRDALKDAYAEALDLCVYLRQAIFERDGK